MNIGDTYNGHRSLAGIPGAIEEVARARDGRFGTESFGPRPEGCRRRHGTAFRPDMSTYFILLDRRSTSTIFTPTRSTWAKASHQVTFGSSHPPVATAIT